MPSFVLVHGGAHGAWCWERLIPHLQAGPDTTDVVAVDLVGHGAREHEKPPRDIRLADYVDDIVSSVEGNDLRDVVLVGHSLAGISISAAAARLGDRTRHVVHLSTTVPPPGQTPNELIATHPLSPISREADLVEMFCNDLDDNSTAWVLSNLGPEPPGPLDEPMTVCAAPPGISSTYIVLTQDAALPPAFQREQARTAEVDRVVSFEAGHSAFVSRPEDLAALLLDLTAGKAQGSSG